MLKTFGTTFCQNKINKFIDMFWTLTFQQTSTNNNNYIWELSKVVRCVSETPIHTCIELSHFLNGKRLITVAMIYLQCQYIFVLTLVLTDCTTTKDTKYLKSKYYNFFAFQAFFYLRLFSSLFLIEV